MQPYESNNESCIGWFSHARLEAVLGSNHAPPISLRWSPSPSTVDDVDRQNVDCTIIKHFQRCFSFFQNIQFYFHTNKYACVHNNNNRRKSKSDQLPKWLTSLLCADNFSFNFSSRIRGSRLSNVCSQLTVDQRRQCLFFINKHTKEETKIFWFFVAQTWWVNWAINCAPIESCLWGGVR